VGHSRVNQLLVGAVAIALAAGCTSRSQHSPPAAGASPAAAAHPSKAGLPASSAAADPPSPLPGSTETASTPPASAPAGLPADVYAADHAGMLSPAVAGDVSRVYVPNSEANTVDVIDPATYRVVAHFAVGKLPQHVTPSWDLKTLYVDNDMGNTLTPIDARTGTPGTPIPVEDPYNLYFTADGTKAIVVAERFNRLDFRDPHTFALIKSVQVPCRGVDHMDYTADARFALASCEFSGQMLKIDLADMSVASVFALGSSPQDVKLSPDGRTFYVADQNANGVFLVDAATFTRTGFIATGRGAHGLYVSRDSSVLYVSDRGAGMVTVIDLHSKKVVHQWHIGGSPDMGGVSADGRQLWLSGRHDSAVYVIDTRTGALLHRIPVGHGPHGLSVFPQPGRYSIGHTGIFR
jgi:YVTN family beta-propeller protein